MVETLNEDGLRKLTAPVRNHYFYGKLMDAYHFSLESEHSNRKRCLINRLILGTGVVCGLVIAPTNDGSRIRIGPGVVIERLGREIIVPAETPPIDPRQPTDDWGRPMGDRIEGEGTVTLCLAYHECEAEPVPIMVGNCGAEQKCAPSIICERYRVLVKQVTPPLPAIELSCSQPNPFAPSAGGENPPNIHNSLVDRISKPCPEITGDTCIVIAQINLLAPNVPITASMIDLSVRPLVYSNDLLLEMLLCKDQGSGGVPGPPGSGLDPNLIKVEGISWTHDQDFILDRFIGEGLIVTFTGDIAANSTGRGWFIVTAEYPVSEQTEDPTVPPGTILVQRVLDKEINVSGRQAIFKPFELFRDTFLQIGRTRTQGTPILFRVVLKCNFLVNANDPTQIVDGDFFGSLPSSGNQVRGGDFESWFFIKTNAN